MRPIIFRAMLLTTILFSQSLHAESPIKSGVYGLTANASYRSTERQPGNNSKSYFFSPGILYFINSKIGVGGGVLYSQTSSDAYTRDGSTIPALRYSSYTLSTKFRYYFAATKPLPFVQLTYGLGKQKIGRDSFSGAPDSDETQYSVQLGMDYFIARNVALEPSLSYYSYKILGLAEVITPLKASE